MSKRDDPTLLRDIVEAARSAWAGVAGRDMASLAADHVRALGLVKCIEIIGEAAGRLSEGFRAGHPNIPWAQIVRMRNRLVHAYFDIDYEQVWKTLTEDLPPLIQELEAVLASEFSEEA